MVNGTTKNIYLLRHGKVEGKAALNGLSDVLVNPNIQQRICDALRPWLEALSKALHTLSWCLTKSV